MPFAPLVDPVEDLPADERVRTARHRVMFDFGDAAQRRLAAAPVAVVGAGGLGSAVILALAAAGGGTLTVIDVRAAADLSATRVIARRARLDTRNAADLLAGAHVIVDGSDTFDTRRAVAAASESAGLPLVWGTVQEFAGQATVFWSRPSAGTPIVLDDLYPAASVGTLPSCAEVGVFGPLCLQIGAVLATETVKHVTGVGEPLLGRVLLVDALRGTQREVPLRPARVSA